MPNSITNKTMLQPNPYAGGRVEPPIIMPTEMPGAGGDSTSDNKGWGQNSVTIDDDLSLSGPSIGLNGTPQTHPPYPSGNVQLIGPNTDFINTVPGMVPGTIGPGQSLPSDRATGWRREGNDWYYFDPNTGNLVKGWKMINGRWYYLNLNTGRMETGWIKPADGLWYYLDPGEGHMLIDWQKIDGEWYFLETDKGNGHMVTGWKKHNNDWYFLFDSGTMAHGGWVNIDGKWYCFRDSTGEMEASKIISYNGKKYYVGEDGAMVTNSSVTYKGITYEIDENGVCTAIRNNLDEKIENWMACVESIGTWYTGKVTTYLAGPPSGSRKYYTCELINKDVGDDCSSMVSACLVLAGIANSTGYNSYSFNKRLRDYNLNLGDRLKSYGFSWHSFDSSYIPQRGDISVQHETYIENGKNKKAHHVEVVAFYDENARRCYVWSWGKVYSNLPTSRVNWDTRTSGYWRIEE